MAYARFSTDGHNCDVYVYVGVDGWVTHVAAGRHELVEPLPAPLDPCEAYPSHIAWAQAYFDRSREVSRILRASTVVPIGGPYDGRTFIDHTAAECAQRLEDLRAAGYLVPQSAVDGVRADEPQ